jgi:hypothetical protein
VGRSGQACCAALVLARQARHWADLIGCLQGLLALYERTGRDGAIYRTAKALIGGQQPAAGDEEIINRAAVAPPPVPGMGQGAVALAAAAGVPATPAAARHAPPPTGSAGPTRPPD